MLPSYTNRGLSYDTWSRIFSLDFQRWGIIHVCVHTMTVVSNISNEFELYFKHKNQKKEELKKKKGKT